MHNIFLYIFFFFISNRQHWFIHYSRRSCVFFFLSSTLVFSPAFKIIIILFFQVVHKWQKIWLVTVYVYLSHSTNIRCWSTKTKNIIESESTKFLFIFSNVHVCHCIDCFLLFFFPRYLMSSEMVILLCLFIYIRTAHNLSRFLYPPPSPPPVIRRRVTFQWIYHVLVLSFSNFYCDFFPVYM